MQEAFKRQLTYTLNYSNYLELVLKFLFNIVIGILAIATLGLAVLKITGIKPMSWLDVLWPLIIAILIRTGFFFLLGKVKIK